MMKHTPAFKNPLTLFRKRYRMTLPPVPALPGQPQRWGLHIAFSGMAAVSLHIVFRGIAANQCAFIFVFSSAAGQHIIDWIFRVSRTVHLLSNSRSV